MNTDRRKNTTSRNRIYVLDALIDTVTMQGAVNQISSWANARESRYVCICNAHSVVTASQDPAFKTAVNGADMATPDGAPVAWMLRKQGAEAQQRVSGPDLMLSYCEHAAANGESIFLLGSTPTTLTKLKQKLADRWPNLKIAGAISPPFRPLTPGEEGALVENINASGAKTIWVSLGCPKQELWMAAQRGRINGVMLGVGAAFDFHAGTIQRAPAWMQRNGLEWLYRVAREPNRLWRRYLTTNTAFIAGAIHQLINKSQCAQHDTNNK